MKMQFVGPVFTLVAAIALFGAVPAAAQDELPFAERRAWLGFAWADVDGRVVVQRVVAGSPAQRAGLQIGDLVVRIDDRAATPDALEELGRTLEPGDTVRLDVRWDGRERTVDVVAASRPPLFVRAWPSGDVVTFRPDTLEHTIRAYLDSARISLERVHVPRIRIERTDSTVTLHMGDEPIIVLADSLRGGAARISVHPDRTMRAIERLRRARSDSSFRARRLGVDSARRAFRLRMDSLRASGADRPGVFERMSAARDGPGAPWILRRTSGLGRRAVAGAEFSELNPGLARYFRTEEGLLVLRVLPDTPAARAGLEAGDVVVSVAGRPTRSIDDLRFAVAAHPDDESIELEIVREGERRTLGLENDEE